MSLRAFRDIISGSFEREDTNCVNSLHSKLKERLSELVTVSRSQEASTMNDPIVYLWTKFLILNGRAARPILG